MKALAGTLCIQRLFPIVPSQLASWLPIQPGLLRFSWDHSNIPITRDVNPPLPSIWLSSLSVPWRDHTWHVVSARDRSHNELPALNTPREARVYLPQVQQVVMRVPIVRNLTEIPWSMCYETSHIINIQPIPAARVALPAWMGPAVRNMPLFLVSILPPHKEPLANGAGLLRPGITHWTRLKPHRN